MDIRRRRLLKLAVAPGLVTLAGCSDSDGTDPETDAQPQEDGTSADGSFSTRTPTTILTPTSTPTQTPTQTPTPTDTPTQTPTQTPTPTDTPTQTPTQTPTPDQFDSQSAKIAAIDGDSGDEFGSSIAMANDGSTALVGAISDEDPNGEDDGSAYVFTRSGDSWSQETKLVPDDGDSNDGFSFSVALSADGETALIGDRYDDIDGQNSGSAYVFSRDGGSWTQDAKLVSDDGDTQDFFGTSVGMANNGATALISAAGDNNPNGDYAGSMYVFSRSGGSWSQETRFAPDDGDSGDLYGYSVAITADASTALIGAPGDDDPNGKNSGSAYVFTNNSGSWTQETKLTADDGDSRDDFGASVSIAGNGVTAIIGAPGDDDPNGAEAGSSYVFTRDGESWTQQTKLIPDDGDSEDEFGYSVAIANDGVTALVGAVDDEDPHGEDSFTGGGSAYMFSRDDGSWFQHTKLAPNDGDANDDFGSSIAVTGDGSTVIIGARSDENPNGENAGSAYVFEFE